MDYLPIALDIRNQPCLVVGGGDIAARKTQLLLRAQARVTLVAPQLSVAAQALIQAKASTVVHVARVYQASDLQGHVLVIAATDDEQVNAQVAAEARHRAVPVNVVDRPELCSFTMPSIVDRSPILIAVSTGGASPVLARLLRARLETFVPASFGRLASLLSSLRGEAKARMPDSQRRRRFWEKIVQGPVAELVFAGREDDARKAIQAALAREDGDALLKQGEVYLVGAGPGDPDLLTFRALRLMQQADVVLYDRLVAPGILDLVRRDAERIYVGKHRSLHTLRQEEINETLVRLAQQGKRVLRLKGGDPFIFGRGGEEIDTLAEHAIPFQVVPGITAAAGCAAYAGIPLTHRDHAQAVVFVTGQLQDGTVRLNWDVLLQPQQTVVVYMGLAGVEVLCAELIQRGMDPAMPVALIERGTTPEQRVLTSTLVQLPGVVKESLVHAPTLLVIGEVVRLRDKLAWFEKR